MAGSSSASKPEPMVSITSSMMVPTNTQTMKLARLSTADCPPACRNSADVMASDVAPITTPVSAPTPTQPVRPMVPG